MKKLLLTALILFSVIASGNDVVMPQEHKLELGRFDTIANGQDTLVIYHVLPLPMHLRELIINIHEIEDTFEDSDSLSEQVIEKLKKGSRKAAKAECRNDRTFKTDQDGNLLEFIEYYYQGDKSTGQATWVWDNGKKKGVAKTIKRYNDAGKQLLEAKYTWNLKANGGLGDWKGSTCTEWKYDASGRNTDIIEYFGVTTTGEWQGSNWKHYDYENYIEPVGATEYTWDYEKNEWEAIYKEGHILSATLTVDSIMEKNEDGKWVGLEKTLEERDNLTNIIREESYNGWDENGWIGNSKTTKKFQSSRWIEQITYKWSNGWVENEKKERVYSGSNLLDDKSFTNSGGKWVGKSRVTKTYDGSATASTTNWKWDSNASDWTQNDSTHYTYAYSGKIDEEILVIRTNNEWVNSKKTKNTYNASKYVIETAVYLWKAGDWIGSEKTEYEYSGTLVSQKTYSIWDGAWVPSTQERHSFSGSNDTLTVKAKWVDGAWLSTDSMHWILRQETINKKTCTLHTEKRSWASSSGKWKTTAKTTETFDEKANSLDKQTFTFNNNGDCTQIIRQEYAYWNLNKSYKTLERKTTWNGTEWVGNTKTERTFNDKNKTTMEAKYNAWDATKGAENLENGWWQSSATTYKTETEYNASNLVVEQIKSKWDKTKWAWVPYTKTGNEYTNNKNTAIILSNWDTKTGEWIPSQKTLYEYDGSKKVKEIAQTYDTDKEEYVNQTRKDYQYTDGVSAASRTDEFIWIIEDNESGKWCQTKHTEYTYEGTTQRSKEVSVWENCELKSSNIELYHNECDEPIYVVTFMNWDSLQLTSITVKKGATPLIPAVLEEPTRESDAQYTYIFNGWGNGLVAADRDTAYVASFDQMLNKYLITFQNEDGSTIEAKEYEYGATPVAPADPTKDATAQYTYTFNGWDNTIVAVTGEATYKATFTSTLNKYLITFQNEDGSTIEAKEYEYGATPVAPADPTKQATAQYTYTFSGWDNTIVAVTGEATYKATFTSTLNKYLITFQNEDGSTIEAKEYEYGATPVAPADPTKDATAQYTYTFSGWDNTIVAVTGEATYKATFSSTVNKYTITWVDGDGNILSTEEVAYGDTPAYTGDTPTKTATDEYTYEFNNSWSPAIVPVTGDATYTALFTETGITPSTYIVTFMDDEGNVLFYEIYSYGETPDPSYAVGKESDAQYDYTFAGWSPALGPVTGDVTYTATFTATVRSYTITFVNDDGTTLYEQVLEYGQMPEYVGDVPTKQDDELYTYTFSGWSPEIEMVAGAATYTATYTAELKQGTAIDNTINEQPVIKVMENGVLYIIRAGQKFTVTGILVQKHYLR
ncbi:MAG: hypothetical protein IKO63_04630 [Paludibacteraceae bacterium]|nr:hypothetical protein [Paludibacteraceae bacterium]